MGLMNSCMHIIIDTFVCTSMYICNYHFVYLQWNFGFVSLINQLAYYEAESTEGPLHFHGI